MARAKAEVVKTRKRPKGSQSAAAFRSLPICVVLVVCDQAVVGQDKVISAIRIVDTISLSADQTRQLGVPVELRNLTLLAMLKTAEARGEYTVKLLCRRPSGERTPLGEVSTVFTGEPQGGGNIVVPLRLHWEGPGFYWIEVEIEGTLIGRTPLKVQAHEQHAGEVASEEASDQSGKKRRAKDS